MVEDVEVAPPKAGEVRIHILCKWSGASMSSKTNNANARHRNLPYVSDARLRWRSLHEPIGSFSSDEYTRSGNDPEVSGRHWSHIDDLSDDICCKGNFPAILGHEGGGIVNNHHWNITKFT